MYHTKISRHSGELSPGKSMARGLRRRWFLALILLSSLYSGLPFLAPVLMEVGWSGPGKAIYLLYSFLCHQLPQRSFFLFGPEPTYNLAEIVAAWQPDAVGQNPSHLFLLRGFIGNPDMGWKVAWSDRMVSMFTSLPVFGLLWWSLRHRLPRLPWWGLVLFLLPMAADGATHFISDLGGIGQGFRDTNAWLAALTGRTFPASFYLGDALGSFNSWMRLVTGLLFGLGAVWFAFPFLDNLLHTDNE